MLRYLVGVALGVVAAFVAVVAFVVSFRTSGHQDGGEGMVVIVLWPILSVPFGLIGGWIGEWLDKKNGGEFKEDEIRGGREP